LAINNNEKNYFAISFFFRDYVRHPFLDSGGGVNHVFVNGVQVLKDGEHTGATPGKVVRGPRYKK